MKIAIIIFMIIFIMYCIFICYIWQLDDFSIINFILRKHKFNKCKIDSILKNVDLKDIDVEHLIKVTRKDKSIRYVTILKDESNEMYRLVNLTKYHNHIYKCNFKTYQDAIDGLKLDPNVKHWEYIK